MRGKTYPRELHERAVRLVSEHRAEYSSENAAIKSVASKLGMHFDTLRVWIRQAQVESGERPGITQEEHVRIRELQQENRELRQANEILRAAAAFFAFMPQ